MLQVSMALSVTSPCGYVFEEEEEVAVFESTAAEFGGLTRPRLPELSLISPGLDPRPSTTEQGSSEKVQVFLRIRPLSHTEKDRGEEQGCVAMQDEKSLLLRAPKESQNMRTAERGITQSVHKFSFSKIFGPETTQQQFYENTMKKMVNDVLQGENRLLYTYGVTNSGKTYTIQGSGREAGLLPRALVSLFRKLQGRLYGAMNLKPVMYHNVRELEPSEVRAEELRRNSLLKEVKKNKNKITFLLKKCQCKTVKNCYLQDENTSSRRPGGFTTVDSGIGGLSSISNIASQLNGKGDGGGGSGGKDLTWIQVRSAEEAWKILKAGRCNQSFASTHLNHNSSRSHSIFSVRILHVRPEGSVGQATNISELTVCDLAGSERCKEQRNGERMKEANNINTSLLTLGRCIAALRNNQNLKSRLPQVVPFRDSKLTRVLQGYFCGRGTSCMVVNINPCASIYDETLQALKFSAIATQVGNAAVSFSTFFFYHFALLQAIDVLKREVQRQREEKELLEANVREQVVCEMMEVINEMQDGFSETLDSQRALIEERYEDKINNLQKHLKKFYSEELKVRPEKESEPPRLPPGDGPRRSQRLSTLTDVSKMRADLEQCQAELFNKTQGNLRQLRENLQKLGVDLQSGERACCRNTGGERLRQTLNTADETLVKQDQVLMELQNSLALVKSDMRRKAETLAKTAQAAAGSQLPPRTFTAPATPGSCKRRGCGAAAAATPDTENRPPTKRQFFQSLFPSRKYNTRGVQEEHVTPYSRILRSRQHSPPPSPVLTPRGLRGKY
uniref:Kinesin-like protein n=1 Tax=Cynoglossus semilaevis TaxID=244447 RepID=A0A3P8WYB4_CYNSE